MSASDPSWVWPFWLERQLDPSSTDFVPGTAGDELVNLTHRNTTIIGNLATDERAAVDPRGLLTPDGAGWSLDWWIGAEDRWHVPSRAGAVRQRLVDRAPVVETAMRVPGGDAVARTYAMVSTSTGPCAVMEIRNATAVPFALVIAVRPFGPFGHLPIHEIGFEGSTVTIDGTPSVLFARPPGRAALSNQEGGDSATHIFDGRAPVVSADPISVRCDAGWATASFVFPLPHTAVAQVVVPLRPPVAAAGRRARDRPVQVAFPDAVPAAEQVAAGWAVQSRRSTSVSLPDERLMGALDAAIRHLLLIPGSSALVDVPGEPLGRDDTSVVLEALGIFGFTDEVASVLRTSMDDQPLDGSLAGETDRMDANAAVIGAIAAHWSLTHDTTIVEDLIGPIAKAAHWINKRRSGRRTRRDTGSGGLLPEGAAPACAGPPGVYFRDAARSARALADLAPALEAAGQPEVAADVRRFASSLVEAMDVAIAAAVADTGGPVPPTPSRRLDAGTVANLSLVAPLGVHRPSDPAIAATIELVRSHLTCGPAVVQGVHHVGLSPDLTMQLASAELEAGDPALFERLSWMTEVGGDTVTWPGAVHPVSRGGSWGRPDDPVALARFVTVVRRLAIREVEDTAGSVTGLAMCTVVPPRWLGQPIDVRDAPTKLGRFSYSVRWHGDRPALLWELDPHPDVDAATFTAPGLDPAWSATSFSGEALLATVPVPEELHDHDHDHDHETDAVAEPAVARGSGASTPSTEPSFLAVAGMSEVSVDLAGTLRARATAPATGTDTATDSAPDADPTGGGALGGSFT